jgi:putative ABC transport system substrate-binding protein
MRRRKFIALLASAAVCPLTARSQQRALPVVGFLDTATPEAAAPFLPAFHKGLSEAGFDNGRNVLIEYRWGEGDYDKLPRLATELVRRGVAVLATVNTPSVLAAKMATQTIPILFVFRTLPQMAWGGEFFSSDIMWWLGDWTHD